VKKKANDQGSPIPVIFMPRKPHPNGLMNYLAATAVQNPIKDGSKIPYVLDILPHLKVGDAAPRENLKEFLNRWKEIQHPHIVVDAAFGSLDMASTVNDWGGTATLSCNSSTHCFLWEVLSTNLPPGTWRIAYHPETHLLASCHAVTDDNGKKHYQQIISSHWTVELPIEDADGNPTVEDQMPVFKEEELAKLKVAQLREICKKYQIRQGKKKGDFIEKILKRSETVHQHAHQVDHIFKSISSDQISDPAPPHDLYKEWFSLIDKADKRWYSVEDSHRHEAWQTKLALGILRIAVMNAWVYASNFNYAHWIAWRESLLKELLAK